MANKELDTLLADLKKKNMYNINDQFGKGPKLINLQEFIYQLPDESQDQFQQRKIQTE